jgi:hypothetical protein
MQDHPQEHLHPSSAGPHFPGDNRGPRTTGGQHCSSHSGSWLVYICTAEARTWDAPLVSSTRFNSYLLGWPLQGFPHVLNVTREPLLGPLHSHTLYHAPTNRSGVTSAHMLPRFARLLVSNTKSPRVKHNTGYICHGKQGNGSCLGSMFEVTLPGSPSIAVHQDHHRDHYREKNSHPCSNAMEIQTHKSRWCSLTLGGPEHQSREWCSREEGQKRNRQACVLIM